MTLQVNRDH